VIESSWKYGVGIGDVKNELIDQYLKNNNFNLAEQKLNAHNQYLETTIGLGITGVAILIIVLFIPFFRKKNYILYSFLILIIVNFLFESMLNTQAGVTFFAFFYALLIRSDDRADLVSSKTQL
ncbi:MAG: hypothetical protein ABIJ97_15770, partial [Bacteroidota bacterium]